MRKRLAVWSLPFVLALALVAAKLLTMVALGDEAVRAYASGNVTGTENAGQRLEFLNLIEPHKAPFVRGDARVLAGDYDGARAAFEEALALAPRDSRESCQIRVNLALSLEKLGQAAQTAGHADVAKQYFDRVQQVVNDAPPGCFEGDAQDEEGQQLRDAQQRAQDQNQQQDQQDQQSQNQQQQPSEDKQQQLDDKTRDNLNQRQQGDEQHGAVTKPPVDKPW
jgi:tetratricopeptide (TPR) repeat protein